jgi:beta-galactosidase
MQNGTLFRWIALFLLVSCALADHMRGQVSATKPQVFTIEGEHFLLDGKPFRILSGELHYARIPREYWRQRLRMAKAMGLNTVATYVFWNVHEPEPGVYNFKGNADLAAFLRMAQEEGLYVLLRAGPYSCAEWDLGGFPAWLLKTPESQKALRSNDPAFLVPVERWLMRLGQEVRSLQIGRGGPILATQIENEYGNFGSDQAYLTRLKDIFLQAGFTDSLLYTADNWRNIRRGILPGVYAATNFGPGNHEKGMEALAQLRPGQPLFVSEYWPGWFDHWGQPHQTRPVAPQKEDLDYILAHGSGVNIYMFHGGTSFGFMSGSSWTDKKFLPDVTSYDYDAPLDEAGNPTAKFFVYREVLARYAPGPLPPVPPGPPVVSISGFALNQSSSLWKNLPQPINTQDPQPMEHLDQAYGYILYRTRIPGPRNSNLELDELHDYAHIFLDGKLVGTLDRRLGQNSLSLRAPAASNRLDILVENSGRVNSQSIMRDELKGITRQVLLDGKPLRGWQIFRLPLSKIEDIQYRANSNAEPGPAFFRGFFELSTTGDTFLDVHTLGKGAVWINGYALGRFWNVGPQQTLYVPGPWLRHGKNEVVVFDLFGKNGTALPHLSGLSKPVLDATTE